MHYIFVFRQDAANHESKRWFRCFFAVASSSNNATIFVIKKLLDVNFINWKNNRLVSRLQDFHFFFDITQKHAVMLFSQRAHWFWQRYFTNGVITWQKTIATCAQKHAGVWCSVVENRSEYKKIVGITVNTSCHQTHLFIHEPYHSVKFKVFRFKGNKQRQNQLQN